MASDAQLQRLQQPTAAPVDSCDAVLFFAPRLDSAPQRMQQQQDASGLPQQQYLDGPDFTGYNNFGGEQGGYLPPFDQSLAYHGQQTFPNYHDTYPPMQPLGYGPEIHYTTQFGHDPNQSSSYYWTNPPPPANYGAGDHMFAPPLAPFDQASAGINLQFDPTTGAWPPPPAAYSQPRRQPSIVQELEYYLQQLQPVRHDPSALIAPSPKPYGGQSSGCGVLQQAQYDQSNPTAAFIAPTPKPCDASGGYLPVLLDVQPGRPEPAALPMMLQRQMERAAQLGFNEQQQAKLSAVAVQLWVDQQPFFDSHPSLENVAQPQSPAFAHVKEEVDDDFEGDNWNGLDGDAAAAAARHDDVNQTDVGVKPGEAAELQLQTRYRPQNPDVARLLQGIDVFEGDQRQFIIDFSSALLGMIVQLVREGFKPEKISIKGVARFDWDSVMAHVGRYPAIFQFPGRDKKHPVLVDLYQLMPGYSSLTTDARTSINSFVKHVMHAIYSNPGASLKVTAGCTRSTVGLHVLPESSVRVLSNFWMVHFKATPPQDERDVFEVMTQIVKNYLDRRRSDMGRRSGGRR